jgi:predicted nucleic acid-binding protein
MFREQKFILCYTTEILNEYHEILSRYYTPSFAGNVMKYLQIARNTEQITVYYKWQLIIDDPDDNKFVDCAICANARFIVSNDRHFNILEEIDFPKVDVLTIEEFKEIM